MGGRQSGDSAKYVVNPHSENPNESYTGLECLWDPKEKGKNLEIHD